MAVAALLLLAPAIARASDLTGSLGVGIRATDGLGYEQKVDPRAWASFQWDAGDFELSGRASNIWTRKAYLPSADDRALALSWLASWAPGERGILLGAGGWHTSLWTSQWEKLSSGPLFAIGYRWGGDYRPRLLVSYAELEDEVVDGVPSDGDYRTESLSASYSIRQRDRRWFSGYSIRAQAIRFDYRGERLDGFTLTLDLAVVSR